MAGASVSQIAPRTRLHADPAGVFLHDAILASCRCFARNIAIVDTSYPEPRRLAYAEYGELVEALARGFVAAGVRPGEVIAIYLYNSWEFAAAYHAATLAGAIPTPLNPSYREREVRYQLEDSGAALLVTDGTLIRDMNLAALPALRRVYTTRTPAPGAQPLAELLALTKPALPAPGEPSEIALAALPYSSGTTGLPKGVMLTHGHLVTNVYQILAPGEAATFGEHEVALCVLPLYHIYGLNVLLNPILTIGATLVLAPRFDLARLLDLIVREGATFLPLVPPLLNCLTQAAEQGQFPAEHRVRAVKSGAAPLAPELPRRFTALTGIPPEATAAALHPVASRGNDDWYWSGDVATRDEQGFFQIVDRRKEMIKYKGFPVAPAEVEAVLLEHAAVRDCGVIGKPDADAGEVPCAFVVLREGQADSPRTADALRAHVAERLTGYKQPREVRFVPNIPRNPSGKILRRELRKLL